MPTVPLGLRVVATYLGPGGATAANVMHFINIGGDFDSTAMAHIADGWIGFWKQMASSSWLCNGLMEASDLTVDPPDVIFANGTTETGDGASACLPAQCAFVLSLRSVGGRRGRGRIYLPGITEGDVTDGSQVDAAFVALAVAEFSDYASEIATTDGWLPAIYSRTDGVVRAALTVGADTVVDTQRRRVERLA